VASEYWSATGDSEGGRIAPEAPQVAPCCRTPRTWAFLQEGKGLNFLTTPVLYGLLALSALLGIATGVQTLRLSSEKAAHSATKADNAAAWTRQADLATKAEQAARRAEEANAAAALVAKDQLTAAITEGNARAKSLTADLVSERRKLRDFWQGNACPMPEDSAAIGGGQDAATLRAESAGRIIGSGADADARINYLIARYTAAEKLCGMTQ